MRRNEPTLIYIKCADLYPLNQQPVFPEQRTGLQAQEANRINPAKITTKTRGVTLSSRCFVGLSHYRRVLLHRLVLCSFTGSNEKQLAFDLRLRRMPCPLWHHEVLPLLRQMHSCLPIGPFKQKGHCTGQQNDHLVTLRMHLPAGPVGLEFIRGDQLMAGKVIVVLVEAGIYFGITSINNRLLIRSNDNKLTIQIFVKFHCLFLCRISVDVLERNCYPLNYFSCCRSTHPNYKRNALLRFHQPRIPAYPA